jgi:hypothetical protein
MDEFFPPTRRGGTRTEGTDQDRRFWCDAGRDRKGPAAARAVFEKADITPEQAADAVFSVEGWDDAGFPDDDAPSDFDFKHCNVRREADEAAAAAVCERWPESRRIDSADLELVDPESDACREKMMAAVEAFARGLTPGIREGMEDAPGGLGCKRRNKRLQAEINRQNDFKSRYEAVISAIGDALDAVQERFGGDKRREIVDVRALHPVSPVVRNPSALPSDGAGRCQPQHCAPLQYRTDAGRSVCHSRRKRRPSAAGGALVAGTVARQGDAEAVDDQRALRNR